MDCFGNSYEGAKKKNKNGSYRTNYITQAVARATLPLDVCHSRFGGGKSEIKRRVWQRGHRAEGNAESGKRKRKLERGDIRKKSRCSIYSEKKHMKKSVNRHRTSSLQQLGTKQTAYQHLHHMCELYTVLRIIQGSHPVRNRLCRHLTDLVARRSPLQQQAEAIGGLLVVLQALTEPTIVILHQPPVHNHFKLA